MIFSKQLMFSEAQAVTTTAGSTNVVDLGATGTVLGAPAALVRDIGKGRPIPIYVQLDDDADDPADTLDVTVEVDSVENFASPKTVGAAVSITGGAEGDRVALHYVPRGADERYLRLKYTVSGDTPAYVITAGIVLADQTNVVPGA